MMRTCISCGDAIPDKKRRDAKYCDKAGCRGREYRKRQAGVATARPERTAHHASTVLSCPCGRQYLLQVHELAAKAPSTAPKLPPATLLPASITQTVSLTEPLAGAPETQACNPAPAPQALTQTVLPTAQRLADASLISTVELSPPEALTQTDRSAQKPAVGLPLASASSTPDLVILELYFTDERQRRIPFVKAMRRHGDGRWSLQPNAQVAFGYNQMGRSGLGGKPGAWRKFYGDRSPSEFGYEPDLAVMSWNRKSYRGQCVSIELLRDILGDDWKEKLRAVRDGKS